MRYLLGAILIVLGIWQLIELQTTNPQFGLALTFLVVTMWIVEVIKEIRKNAK